MGGFGKHAEELLHGMSLTAVSLDVEARLILAEFSAISPFLHS